MNIPNLHAWNVTPTEAVALQRDLASRIDVSTPLENCELIAGTDCSYNRFSPKFYAAVVVLRASDCSIVETQGVVGESPFPYIPGLLSFRELPMLLEAFAKLEHRPDAVMVDGQGLAHPRRLGIACHLGLWLDLPCFGCAKSRLVGDHDEPGPEAGAMTKVTHKGEIVANYLRTKRRTKPVYISPGHRIDLESATRWTLATRKGYRIPEPTRQAHLYVNQMRLAEKG